MSDSIAKERIPSVRRRKGRRQVYGTSRAAFQSTPFAQAGLFLPLGDTDASGGLDGAEAAALFAALTVPPGSALEAASFAAAAACAVAAKDTNE